MTQPPFSYEIEDSPIRALVEQLCLRGWCANAQSAIAPDVRLRVDDVLLPPTERFQRADVAKAIGLPEDGSYGFIITGQIRPGAHLATLEALADGAWRLLRRFTIVVTPAPLAGAIEKPLARGPLNQSARVQGWCAHPRRALDQVELSYGNVRLSCEWGLPRSDVPSLVPSSPDAERAGFIAKKNLPASRGALRIRAIARDGSVHFLHPELTVDIDLDQDRRSPLQLPDRSAARLGPARRPHPHDEPAPASPALKLLFVLYGDFTSNSAIHVMNLARQFARRGHQCTVAVPRHAETAAYFPDVAIHTCDFEVLKKSSNAFDIAHAWTTRENVRLLCAHLREQGRIGRLCVHLEDNELRILESSVGRTLAELHALAPRDLDRLVPDTLSHPIRSREFLRAANGVTVIIDTLREHVPSGQPVHTIWPAADARVFFPRERPSEFRRALGWEENRIVLLYHGNTHAANCAEVLELYRAVRSLNAQGRACTLLRLGRDDPHFTAQRPAKMDEHVIELGQVRHHHHLGILLSLADYFVQPGEADAFNDYRLPSKLPEFFAIGRPVILPRTNLGRMVRHGEEAYVLDKADAASIVRAIEKLEASPALRTRLTQGALAFTEAHFNWERSASRLEEFYRAVLAAR